MYYITDYLKADQQVADFEVIVRPFAQQEFAAPHDDAPASEVAEGRKADQSYQHMLQSRAGASLPRQLEHPLAVCGGYGR